MIPHENFIVSVYRIHDVERSGWDRIQR